jgi:hypothetical protein
MMIVGTCIILFGNKVSKGFFTMANTLSKTRKVLNYLANGNTLTAAEARARFGVRNLRATISNIRELVERFGNWEIDTEVSPTGKTRYTMYDTHPGRRAYGFREDGSRYLL